MVVFACTCGESRRTNRDGSVVRYLQLAHNERPPTAGQPVAKVIHSFGRAELVDRAALARLVIVDLEGPHCGGGRRVGRGTGREAGRCRAALTSAAGGPVPTRGPASECDRWPGPALLCNRRPGIPAHGGHGARVSGPKGLSMAKCRSGSARYLRSWPVTVTASRMCHWRKAAQGRVATGVAAQTSQARLPEWGARA